MDAASAPAAAPDDAPAAELWVRPPTPLDGGAGTPSAAATPSRDTLDVAMSPQALSRALTLELALEDEGSHATLDSLDSDAAGSYVGPLGDDPAFDAGALLAGAPAPAEAEAEAPPRAYESRLGKNLDRAHTSRGFSLRIKRPNKGAPVNYDEPPEASARLRHANSRKGGQTRASRDADWRARPLTPGSDASSRPPSRQSLSVGGGGRVRPKQLVCYLCGLDFGTSSLKIHVKSCIRRRTGEQKRLPEEWRRPIPHAPADDDCPMPSSNRDPSGAFDRFNVEAWRIYCAESVGETCDVCHAPFADVDAKLKHACEGAVSGATRPKWLPKCVPTAYELEHGDANGGASAGNGRRSAKKVKSVQGLLDEIEQLKSDVAGSKWALQMERKRKANAERKVDAARQAAVDGVNAKEREMLERLDAELAKKEQSWLEIMAKMKAAAAAVKAKAAWKAAKSHSNDEQLKEALKQAEDQAKEALHEANMAHMEALAKADGRTDDAKKALVQQAEEKDKEKLRALEHQREQFEDKLHAQVEARAGRARATSEAPRSAAFRSFRAMFGRALIARSALSVVYGTRRPSKRRFIGRVRVREARAREHGRVRQDRQE